MQTQIHTNTKVQPKISANHSGTITTEIAGVRFYCTVFGGE